MRRAHGKKIIWLKTLRSRRHRGIYHMKIKINGEKREIRKGQSLAGLVKTFNPSKKRVAVLLNDDMIPREKHATCLLKDGDRVEIIAFAGGG